MRRRSRLRAMTALGWVVVLVACVSDTVEDGAKAFDFMEGSWTSTVDGLSMTLEVERDPDGSGWLERRILDDGNHLVETATLSYDPDADVWTRRSESGSAPVVWSGTLADSGAIVLVTDPSLGMRSEGEPGEIQRLILRRSTDGGDAFTLDVEGTPVGGLRVPLAGTYRRVDRPRVAEGGGRIAFISNRSGNWEVYSMSPSGDDVRNLTRHEAGDHHPRWIAGGARLSFRSQRSRDDGNWDRWEVDVDGTDVARVRISERLANPEAGEFPEVHPTGAFLVNAVERGGEQDIRVWRRDGSEERVVAPAPGLDYRPLFSPDGSRILFISERDGNAEVYTVAFDGSDVRRLTDAPGIDRYARWSPDGTRIGFVSDRDGDLEVYVMQADGSGLRQLTDNQSQDGEISWSPDGTRIVYRSDEDGEGEIHVVHVATGEVTNLTRHAAYDGEPVWSPPLHAASLPALRTRQNASGG